MAVKQDKVQVTVLLDGKQAINALGKLEMEATGYRNELKKIKQGTAEWIATNNRLTEVESKIKALRSELGLAGMTMRQLTKYQQDLNRQLLGVTRGTAEYKKLKAELQAVNNQITAQRADLKGLSGLWSGMQKQMVQFGAMALAYVGFTTLITQINNLIDHAARFSDQLADVRKNTGLTDTEVKELNKTLSQMNTRTARAELLSMAKIAGKLGMTAKADIEAFVGAADKINVALGEDLGNPEQNLKKLGKLINVFQLKGLYGVEEGMLKVGSSINELGKASEAGEEYIVDFTSRLGGIAPLAKISIQDIMGLGAAADSLGLSSETSTTALSKLFVKMTQQRDVFYKYAVDINGASMSIDEFSTLIDTDANAAFLSLLRGVKDNSKGMTDLSDTLDVLGLDGGRVIAVLGALAQNNEVVVAQQKISNESFEKGTSIMEEYAIKNENFAAKLEKVKKAIFSAFVNTSVVSGLEGIVGWMEKMIRVPIVEQMESERKSIRVMGIELLSENTKRERKVEILNELQSKYPNLLTNINLETSSTKEIASALEQVNKHLVNKIILQTKQDEIDEIAKKHAEVRIELIDKEEQAREHLSKLMDKYKFETPEGLDILEQIDNVPWMAKMDPTFNKMNGKLSQTINQFKSLKAESEELDKQLSDMFTNQDVLYKKLFGDQPVVAPPTTKPVIPKETSEKTLDKEQLKMIKDLRDDLLKVRDAIALDSLSSDQQEVAQVERKYEDLMNMARKYHSEKLISDKEYATMSVSIQQMMDDDLDNLFGEKNKEYLKKRKEFNVALAFELMSGQEQEISTITAHYDELIKQAKSYGWDLVAIEEAKNVAIKASNDKYRQIDLEKSKAHTLAVADLIASTADVVTQLNNLTGGQSEELMYFQIALANTAILLQQSVALSAAIAGAANAAAGAGPAAPFVLGAAIVSMVATVLGAFVQVKNVKKQADESKQSAPSFFYGGDTNSSRGLGFGDQHGTYAGYTHFDEFVRPAYLANDPVTMDAENVIKARMAGHSIGTSTAPATSSSPNGLSAEDLKSLRASNDRLTSVLSVLLEKGIEAYFSQDSYSDAKKHNEKIEKIRKQGV